jgi:hypothetical protein
MDLGTLIQEHYVDATTTKLIAVEESAKTTMSSEIFSIVEVLSQIEIREDVKTVLLNVLENRLFNNNNFVIVLYTPVDENNRVARVYAGEQESYTILDEKSRLIHSDDPSKVKSKLSMVMSSMLPDEQKAEVWNMIIWEEMYVSYNSANEIVTIGNDSTDILIRDGTHISKVPVSEMRSKGDILFLLDAIRWVRSSK